jgi:hypothetical protein
MSKIIFQIILAIIALIAVITGFLGLSGGVAEEFYQVSMSNTIEGNIILDSNLRYFSGLSFGLGLIIFWIIPTIEQ